MVKIPFFKKAKNIEEISINSFFSYSTQDTTILNEKLLFFFNNNPVVYDAITWISHNLVNIKLKNFVALETNWINSFLIYGNLFLLKYKDQYTIIDNNSIYYSTIENKYVLKNNQYNEIYFDIFGNGINNDFFLVHIKNIKTANTIMGGSFLLPILNDICILQAGTEYNKNVLHNGARVDGVFTFKGNLPDKQYNSIKNTWQEFFAGVKNVGKTLFLTTHDSDVGYESMSRSNKDMDFIELIKVSTMNIYKCFKIPLPLVETKGQTFSNYTEAQAQLYDNALEPILETIILQLRLILNDPSISIDLDSLPLSAKMKIFDIAKRQNEIGVYTINEIRKTLQLDPLTGGDILRDNRTTPVAYAGEQEGLSLYDTKP